MAGGKVASALACSAAVNTLADAAGVAGGKSVVELADADGAASVKVAVDALADVAGVAGVKLPSMSSPIMPSCGRMRKSSQDLTPSA